MAELADAPDLGSGPARGGGSSPPFRTSVRVNSTKHLALLFLGRKVQSEILRSAQNDSMADECRNVTLSSAIHPLKAKDLRADVLERKEDFSVRDNEW